MPDVRSPALLTVNPAEVAPLIPPGRVPVKVSVLEPPAGMGTEVWQVAPLLVMAQFQPGPDAELRTTAERLCVSVVIPVVGTSPKLRTVTE